MRIRSTKPEFWRSKRIASVSWDARLVLKGLESYVDDNGVGKHDVELIAGDIFSRDLSREGSRILARVSEAIFQLNRAGLVWLYEADGEDLMFLAFWESFQRVDKPQPGRLPRPDGTFAYKESVIGAAPANPREPSRGFAPGTGEQGNRGTGEQGTSLALRTDGHQGVDRDSRNAALRIVTGWEDACHQRPPIQTVRDVTEQVQRLVTEGQPPELIAAGLASWWAGDSYSAKNIAVHVARASRPPKPATGTGRAQDILAIDTSQIGDGQ